MKNINILSENKKYTIDDYLEKNRPENNKKGEKVKLCIRNMQGDILEAISFNDYEKIIPIALPKNLIMEKEIEFLDDYGIVSIDEDEILITGKIKHLAEIELENIMVNIE